MNNIVQKIINNTGLSISFLIILSVFYFIGLGYVHLFDWDEINFAESAREMIVTGNYSLVQINFSPFWEKPPLFFWLQVISMKIFGVNEFAARFPNAVIGIVYLITFYLIGKKWFTPVFGIFWALLFFSSLLPHIYFRSGIIDLVFNYFIFLSVYFTILVFETNKRCYQYAFLAGICSGLSILTKGPVGFLIFLLTFSAYIVFNRFKKIPEWRYFLSFIMGASGIVCIWLSFELFQNGTDNLYKFIQYQLDLFNTPVAGHGQPFYYHFVIVFLGCFPISIFALPSFFKSDVAGSSNFRIWMVILFWVVMILFSITTTKIIHYSSMTYIPLSFLAALYIYKLHQQNSEVRKYVLNAFILIGLFWSIIFILVPYLLLKKELIIPYIKDDFAVQSLMTPIAWTGYEYLTGFIFLFGIIVSAIFLKRRSYIYSTFTTSITLGCVLLLFTFFVLPEIEGFTQGPVISFYKSIRGEDAYIESYGYKSYAQYFYADQKPVAGENRKNLEWLVNGPIDKPVYLVTKSNNTDLDDHANMRLIRKEGGFKFYKRLPVLGK